MHRHRTVHTFAWLAAASCLVLASGSCTKVVGPEDAAPRLNLVAFDLRDPLGPSIEGVHLGDSYAKVEKLLGKPKRHTIMDGTDGGWDGYEFDAGISGSLCLMVGCWSLGEGPKGEHPGPVAIIAVYAGYPGKTREGFGLGSSRADLYRLFGTPATSL